MRLLFIVLFTLTLLWSEDTLVIAKDGDILDDFTMQKYEDKSTSLRFEEIEKIQKFVPTSNKISEGYSKSNFWYKFDIENKSAEDIEYFIQSSENIAHYMDCYIEQENGKYLIYRRGIGYYDDYKVKSHKFPRFQIDLKSGERKRVYIRLYGIFPVFNSFTILNERSLNQYNLLYSNLFAFYFGTAIALILYNLFLYFFSREKVYLFYIMYVFVFIVWQLEANGIYPIDSFESTRSTYLFGAMIVPILLGIYTIFSQEILNTKRLLPRMDRVLRYSSYFYFLLGFIAIFDIHTSYQIVSLLTTFLMPFFLYVGYKSYGAGNKTAIFYIIAQSIFLVASFIFSLMIDGFLEYNLFNRHAYVVGSYLEIILFSIALSYKIKQLESERMEIVTHTNLQLEEKIKSRTIELREMLDRTMEAIGIYDSHILIETNSAALDIYGYSNKEQMLGKNAMHFIAPSSRRLVAQYMRDVYEKPYEIIALKADGSEFPALVQGSHYRSGERVLGMVVVLDMTRIKENEEQLILAKQKAEQATQAKSDFLANMSHEIRTPINGIIGMTHLAQQTRLNDKQKNYLKTIKSSSSLLLNIINDILDFSKMEAGKLRIDSIDFDLYEMIKNIINSIDHNLYEKNLELKINYSKDMETMLYGDSLRLSQILINLVGNAIKFTEEGYIHIGIKQIGEVYSFEIADSGIGMSIEQQSKLFESFSQADTSITRRYGGTGLGLAISKQLVELMGGKIGCESQLGQGSKFTFAIPFKKGNRKNIKERESIDTNQLKMLKGSKILLVEDNLVNQEIVLGLLETTGIEIEIANNGKEAIDLFKGTDYALILMDLQLPIMSGIEACKIIRETDQKIPIIALTANAMREDIEQTQEAGMNEHLSKPIDISELYHVLIKYICKETKYTKPPKTANMIAIPEFQTLDTQLGLQFFAGDHKKYQKILYGFYNNYKELELESLDDEAFKRAIHTIKGLSANIGATKLSAIAKEIEKMGNGNLADKLHKELKLLLEEIYHKTEVETETTKSKKDITPQLRDKLFRELKKAVLSKQARKCKPIIEEIDGYSLSDEEKKSFVEIKYLVARYRFKDAIALVI